MVKTKKLTMRLIQGLVRLLRSTLEHKLTQRNSRETRPKTSRVTRTGNAWRNSTFHSRATRTRRVISRKTANYVRGAFTSFENISTPSNELLGQITFVTSPPFPDRLFPSSSSRRTAPPSWFDEKLRSKWERQKPPCPSPLADRQERVVIIWCHQKKRMERRSQHSRKRKNQSPWCN